MRFCLWKCFSKFSILTITTIALLHSLRASAITAQEIVSNAEELLRGLTSTGTYTMLITRPAWSRKYTIKFWDMRDGDKSLVIIEYPPKDKGTVFLKIKSTLWMYIPRIERTIRIPPSMMMNSWMGSDFTNDDLVKESSIARDYTPEIIGEKKSQDATFYTLKLTPKPDAPVVWGKIIYAVKIPGYIPVKAEYYNDKGELVRVMTFERVKRMHKRVIPTVMRVKPVKKPGHETVLILEDVRFNVKIKKDLFSLRMLKRLKK